ncbi:hypothetical protein K438DRAFT_1764954 [Mycena galopus ATCC 62051]|nr:hypothetical protein K438DRAFT_1764954 [Mycena galopus ATCC 62051]
MYRAVFSRWEERPVSLSTRSGRRTSIFRGGALNDECECAPARIVARLLSFILRPPAFPSFVPAASHPVTSPSPCFEEENARSLPSSGAGKTLVEARGVGAGEGDAAVARDQRRMKKGGRRVRGRMSRISLPDAEPGGEEGREDSARYRAVGSGRGHVHAFLGKGVGVGYSGAVLGVRVAERRALVGRRVREGNSRVALGIKVSGLLGAKLDVRARWRSSSPTSRPSFIARTIAEEWDGRTRNRCMSAGRGGAWTWGGNRSWGASTQSPGGDYQVAAPRAPRHHAPPISPVTARLRPRHGTHHRAAACAGAAEALDTTDASFDRWPAASACFVSAHHCDAVVDAHPPLMPVLRIFLMHAPLHFDVLQSNSPLPPLGDDVAKGPGVWEQ